MTARDHHYVWRHYLEAWGNESGLVHWSMNGEVRSPTNPRNLMVERDYNKLPRITSSDLAFLSLLIESTGQGELRQTHRKFVDDLTHIVQANEMIQSDDRFFADEKRIAQATVIETMEDLHTQIEQSALPILEELRQKRTDFLTDYYSSMGFSASLRTNIYGPSVFGKPSKRFIHRCSQVATLLDLRLSCPTSVPRMSDLVFS